MDSALCGEVCKVKWLEARSGGVSTTMKMCIQADLDTAGAIRHMNKNKSERAVCSLHPPAPGSPSFLFDTEWVMSTCEHHGTRAEITCCRRSEVSLEPSLAILLLQPSMERDKKLCKT